MRLDRGFWERMSERAGAALWTISLGLLGLALAAHAVRAGREGADLERRSAGLGREIDTVKRGNQSLRDELHALEHDPVYVESLLRRWKMAAQGERVIE